VNDREPEEGYAVRDDARDSVQQQTELQPRDGMTDSSDGANGAEASIDESEALPPAPPAPERQSPEGPFAPADDAAPSTTEPESALEEKPADAEVVASPPADPLEGWPEPASAAVIEDVPAEGASVEHVSGEIDIPDGYTVIEGTPTGQRRSVGVVVSRFNGGLTSRMLSRALEALEEAGVATDGVTVMPVPGAFELPLAAMALAKTRRYACVVALGAIVRGETPHFDYVASEAASGLQLAAIETGVPVAFGVLTVETVEQGEARIERAADAVRSALEMADVFAQVRAGAGSA
jgi:6,7-dimethyl-8-ribityllumazine synthase